MRFREFEAALRKALEARSAMAPTDGPSAPTEMLAPTTLEMGDWTGSLGTVTFTVRGWGTLTSTLERVTPETSMGWTITDESELLTEKVSATVVLWISEISGSRDADIFRNILLCFLSYHWNRRKTVNHVGSRATRVVDVWAGWMWKSQLIHVTIFYLIR